MASRLPFVSSRPIHLYALSAIALVAMAGCGGQGQAPHQMPPTAVEVLVAHAQSVPLVREATGRTSAFRSADVRARVSGVLLKREYAEGSHVKQGQLLFQIDPAPLKAALDAAQASLAQAKATYTNAHIAALRAEKLAPKGYVSQADLDDAQARERTAKAAVQAAKAQLESARIKAGYASVRAPITGRAGKQQVTEGALVGQNDATLLTTVRQINPLYVNFSLPISELQRLRQTQAEGQTTLAEGAESTVQLTLPDGSHYAHAGKLDFTGMAVDPATGSVNLRAIVPNPDYLLLPGMYANLHVNLGIINKAFLIPQNALQRDAKGAYVLLVGAGNKVARADVQAEAMRGGDWIVTTGLKNGDQVIVSGIPKARPGSEVKPQIGSAHPPAAAGSGKQAAQSPAKNTKA